MAFVLMAEYTTRSSGMELGMKFVFLRDCGPRSAYTRSPEAFCNIAAK